MGDFEATITKTNAYRMTAHGRGATRPSSSPAHMILYAKAFAIVVPTTWMARVVAKVNIWLWWQRVNFDYYVSSLSPYSSASDSTV